MSLTKALKDKSSPLTQLLADELPDVASLRAAFRTRLPAGIEALVPNPPADAKQKLTDLIAKDPANADLYKTLSETEVQLLDLTQAEKLQLQRVTRSKTSSQRDGLRARIVLRRAEGSREAAVAEALGVSITTVSTWSRRFELQGLEGLRDRPGRGRKSGLAADKVRQVITRVVQPPKGKKKWSTRSMARVSGVSEATVRRIWRKHGLKPHRVRTFKLSNDPRFAEKLADVVGLTSTCRSMRSCCRWTRRPRFKHSTGLSRACL